MNSYTLYLIQSNFANTENALNQLAQIYSPDDAVILMGDAVLHIGSEQLNNLLSTTLKIKNTLFILENDAELLPQQTLDSIQNSTQHSIQIISYAEFSELVLKYKRCISLK
ncbi:MAG: DsrH/TusB family sulfur relay protein [Candidatus Acinetobacter avistercoris]|uniref:DsrH/TusB family sulfur metabolism protein n=1 Tax=Acinetobacter sp. KS-LM10 TaxID=3120518 RepID=UPI001F9DAD8D|nr:DsrH/TusB family sulfur relay protein [Candidatus Acinetobacter avistercoris]